jgi:hypothetical protein
MEKSVFDFRKCLEICFSTGSSKSAAGPAWPLIKLVLEALSSWVGELLRQYNADNTNAWKYTFLSPHAFMV